MASNQWEVVTKSRKQKNMDKKVEAHIEKKRLAAVPIKLEEILPSQQYHNIISGKENKSAHSQPNGTQKSKQKSKSKSPPKKQAKSGNPKSETESGKKQAQAKLSPKPKSPEVVLRQQITPEDFQAHLEQLKLTFPGSELVWLKGVASYLNTSLPFDCDPTFAGKSVYYPCNLLTPKWDTVLKGFLAEMGTNNLSYFYHTLLTSMAMDLAKNQTVFGYKLLLQLIGKNWPEICCTDMAKTALLRNSYQNRSNICLSILWAIGQCGYEQLTDGIKVWQNLMLPNLEMKSYTKFIAEYIERILNCSHNPSVNLNQAELFLTYNTMKTKWPSIAKEYQETLRSASEALLHRYISSTEKHSNLFLILLRDIEDLEKNRIEADACISCLGRSEDCYKVWKMNYKKQIVPTILLLRRIEEEWNEYAKEMRNMNTFQEFLAEANKLNLEMSVAKRRDPNLDELIDIVNNLQEKLNQQKKKQAAEARNGCCFWTIGSLLLIVLIGFILAYDTQVNGKGVFANSACGKTLQKAGLLPHVENAWYTIMSANARAYKWAEKNIPPYANPLIQLTSDVYKLTRNLICKTWHEMREYVSAKLPVAAEFLEQHVPGLPKKIEHTSTEAQKIFVNLIDKSATFFKTQVFIGHFSPENLSKALNETTKIAAEYYGLFEKKVDFYAKLK